MGGCQKPQNTTIPLCYNFPIGIKNLETDEQKKKTLSMFCKNKKERFLAKF
jgi:hypothetical protein